jgi:uncharacterized protein YijF (DUF1287 family)
MRWTFVILAFLTGGLLAFVPPHHLRVMAQQLVPARLPGEAARQPSDPHALALIAAAEAQVGRVTGYDPAYVALDFPMEDVAPDAGVCTDVVIRALRQAHGIDLQALVNADMKAHFADYPANWGLKRPDRNIDHRRVPNLARFLTRAGAKVEGPFQPGDIVTSLLPGNLPHIGIVSDRIGASGDMMVLHNIGAGTRLEDRFQEFPITGHFRLVPDLLARLAG